jgi:hypothetical protein
MSKRPRSVTPPSDRVREKTLEYSSRPVVKIRWDKGKNYRVLTENQPITIGSYDEDDIVVHNNDKVRGSHVTLSLVNNSVLLETHADVNIFLQYDDDNISIHGEFNGDMTAAKNFSFSLYANNDCNIAERYIHFQVTVH